MKATSIVSKKTATLAMAEAVQKKYVKQPDLDGFINGPVPFESEPFSNQVAGPQFKILNIKLTRRRISFVAST